jgi:glycosyltransferase involved in cell wall biosynthesis
MNTGGPAVFLDHLTRSVKDLGCDSTIAYGYCESNESDYLDSHKVLIDTFKIKSLHRSLNPIQDLQAFFQIRKLIKKVRPDLINTHTSKAGVLGRLAAKSVNRKLPVIHTFHGHLIYGYFARFKSIIFTLIEKTMSGFTDLSVAVTVETKNSLQSLGIGKKSSWQVVPIGIPISKHNKPYSSDLSTLKLLWVGRFTDIKDPHYAVRVIQELTKDKSSNFELTMVGDGELFNEVKKVAEGLPIKFTGWVTNPFESIKDFDLLMLTSKNEGLPLVMLEAANCERATIARDVGGLSEFIKNNQTGYLVSAEAADMAKLLINLNQNRQQLREAGISAHKLLAESFSVEVMAKKYVEIYKQLLISK